MRYLLHHRETLKEEVSMTPPKSTESEELHGMFNEDGTPHSNQPSMVLIVPPPPTIEGGSLVWRVDETGLLAQRYAQPDRQLVFDFARLSESPEKVIHEFASRWGMLAADSREHPLPIEAPIAPDLPASNIFRFTLLEGWTDGVFAEPLERWRYFSRVARALLNIATFLHSDEFGRREDWNVLYPAFADDDARWQHQGGYPTHEEAMALEWSRLRDPVRRWLQSADVRPGLFFGVLGKPTVTLSGRALYGALGVQLLFAICRTHGMAVCSGCGKSYPRERRAAHGRRNYCGDCRKAGAPLRDAKRDSDRRKREARLAAGNQAAPRVSPKEHGSQKKAGKQNRAKGRPPAGKSGRTARKATSRK
jgi:hypothetical protein